MFSQFGYSFFFSFFFFFPSYSVSITGLTAQVPVFLTFFLMGTGHQFGPLFQKIFHNKKKLQIVNGRK